MSEEFSQSFSLINTVVYVIIVLAAALAFVVLFTLSTTNISERIRELATIKVLGFRKREVKSLCKQRDHFAYRTWHDMRHSFRLCIQPVTYLRTEDAVYLFCCHD